MSFECKYINDRRGLPETTIETIEQIEAFNYPLLRPKYNSFGELHKTLDVEVNNNSLGNNLDYIERISIADIKARIKELKTEQAATERKNEELLRKMHETEDRNLRNQLERQIRHFIGEIEIIYLKSVLEENCNMPDDYVVEIKNPYFRSGYYTRTGKDAKIVLKHTGLIYGMANVYIHEMMHAYYDSARLGDSPNSIEYVEEPLAEYGMLKFLDVLVKAHPEHSHLLYDAINSVNAKQYTIGLSHYAFGEFLYQNYSHIEWEKLMLGAKNKVDVNTENYKSLQAIFQVRPNKDNWNRAVQLLYDILTSANGMPSAKIVKLNRAPLNIDKNTYDTWLKRLLESGILPSKEEMEKAMNNTHPQGLSATHSATGPSVVIVKYQPPYESYGPNYRVDLEYDYGTDTLRYTISGRGGATKTLSPKEEQEIKLYLKDRRYIEDFFNKAFNTNPDYSFTHARSYHLSMIYGNRSKSVTNGELRPWAKPFDKLCSFY